MSQRRRGNSSSSKSSNRRRRTSGLEPVRPTEEQRKVLHRTMPKLPKPGKKRPVKAS